MQLRIDHAEWRRLQENPDRLFIPTQPGSSEIMKGLSKSVNWIPGGP